MCVAVRSFGQEIQASCSPAASISVALEDSPQRKHLPLLLAKGQDMSQFNQIIHLVCQSLNHLQQWQSLSETASQSSFGTFCSELNAILNKGRKKRCARSRPRTREDAKCEDEYAGLCLRC